MNTNESLPRALDAIYLCAYRRTGKDTLYRYIKDGLDVSDLGWRVYASDGTPNTEATASKKLSIPYHNVKRHAFADHLKRCVCTSIGIPYDADEFESNKESLVITSQPNGEIVTKTRRDWCIHYSLVLKRKYGDDYFAKRIHTDVKHHEGTSIVTDTRFNIDVPNTSDNTMIVRMYRPSTIDSSLSMEMDTYKCDIVLCKSDDDFNKLVSTQPQYDTYTCQGPLVDILQRV